MNEEDSTTNLIDEESKYSPPGSLGKEVLGKKVIPSAAATTGKKGRVGFFKKEFKEENNSKKIMQLNQPLNNNNTLREDSMVQKTSA